MVSEFTPTELVLNLVEAKPFMSALVSGTLSSLILGLDGTEAVAFGATVALGTSFGDAVMTAAGYQTKVQSYLGGSFGTYLDPVDFVAAGAGVTIMNLALGVRGQPLVIMGALAALGGGLAPKISAYVLGSSLNVVSSPVNTITQPHEGAGGTNAK